jgi:hypothetical protein
MKVYNNLDLLLNEITNFRVETFVKENRPDPAENIGRVIYVSDAGIDGELQVATPSAWVGMQSTLPTLLSSSSPITLTEDTDTGEITISIEAATSTAAGSMSAADKTKLDAATDSNTGSTLVFRDVNGDFSAGKITATIVTGLDAPTKASEAVNKQYVDELVSGIGVIRGGWDASTDMYPNPDDITIDLGDYWFITNAGTLGGTPVQPGDMIIATAAAPTPEDWIQVETNYNLATTSAPGLLQIATQDHVNAGTETTVAVTPATLAGRTATDDRAGVVELATYDEAETGTDTSRAITPKVLADYVTAHGAFNFKEDFTGAEIGEEKTYTVQHNYNTITGKSFYATATVYWVNARGTHEEVMCGVEHLDLDSIKLHLNGAVEADEFQVVVVG